MLVNLNLLNIENWVKHLSQTKYLKPNFTIVGHQHSYNTRNCFVNFTMTSCKGQTIKTFYYNGARSWEPLATGTCSLKTDLRKMSDKFCNTEVMAASVICSHDSHFSDMFPFKNWSWLMRT